jgi:membrane protease YdiL (CAAX protease family)
MKSKVSGSANTPEIVRVALFVNVVLVLIALAAPLVFSDPDSTALLFAIPMALILVVGSMAAIRAYILARREDRPLRWTAFAPLAVFLVGILGTLILVRTDAVWERDPVEFKPGQK